MFTEQENYNYESKNTAQSSDISQMFYAELLLDHTVGYGGVASKLNSHSDGRSNLLPAEFGNLTIADEQRVALERKSPADPFQVMNSFETNESSFASAQLRKLFENQKMSQGDTQTNSSEKREAHPENTPLGQGERPDLKDSQASGKPDWAKGVDYTKELTYRLDADDPSSLVKIEQDASDKHFKVTDANGAASFYESSGESSAGSEIERGMIYGKNYKGETEKVGEIKNGELLWTDAAGKEHHDKIDKAVLGRNGDLTVDFADGSKRIYHASGGRADFDSKGRPTGMVDANGNIYKYENYSVPGVGLSALLGGKEYPEKVTVYNPETKKTYQFRREGQLGSAEPTYNVYVDGLPLSGEMTLSAGAGFTGGPVSAGAGISRPIDKECKLRVNANGGLTIRNEKVGWFVNNASEITRNPDGTSVIEDWKYEQTTNIWWAHNTQKISRHGLPAHVGNAPR